MGALNGLLDLVMRIKGITPTELSRRSGVSASQISRYCRGERDLNTSNFLLLLRAMPEDARKVIADYMAEEFPESEAAVRLLK